MRAVERDRPDVRAAREAWPSVLNTARVLDLVFVDESSATTTMIRMYGRSPVGERAVESAPLGHWDTHTMVSAIRCDGPFAPLLLEGALDGEVFTAWVEQMLIPELRPHDVVVLDNVQPHRVQAVARLLAASGHRPVYLPPYSPDLNPIEEMWSKVKHFLRGAKARTWDELLKAMADALKTVTQKDCIGYFRHCGYLCIN